MFRYSVDRACELLQEQLNQARCHGEIDIKVCIVRIVV